LVRIHNSCFAGERINSTTVNLWPISQLDVTVDRCCQRGSASISIF